MVKGTLAVFSALLKSWLRSKSGVFFSILFPVMLLLIFGAVFGGGGDRKYTLHVQNLDVKGDGKPTNLSEVFVNVLNSTQTFDIELIEPTVNVSEYVKKASFSSYRILIIPKGFEQKAINRSVSVRCGIIVDTLIQIEKMYGQYMNDTQKQHIREGREALSAWKNLTENSTGSCEILLLTDEGDRTAPIIRGIVFSVTNAFNNRLIGAEPAVAIAEKPISQRKLEVADYYLPGLIGAFIMTNGIIGVTSVVSELRRNGTLKRLAMSPLPKSSLIIGTMMLQVLLAVILTLFMLILGWVVFGTQAVPNAYALSLIFIGAVMFCSIGMVLGGLIKDVEAATAAGNAIAFPMMFLSGAFWPVEMMPDYMETIAKFLPLYYLGEGLRDIMIYQTPEGAAPAFVIIGILGVIFILIAIKVTKWKELD